MTNKFISSYSEFQRQCQDSRLVMPFCEDTSILSSSIKIGDKQVQNRFVYQAMEGCDGTLDGSPGELTLRRYERFASGGAGIVWVEATAVVKEGRANPRQLKINEENAEKFKALVEDIRTTAKESTGINPILILQLTHSGRYSKPNGTCEPLIAAHNQLFEKDKPIDDSRIVSDEYLDMLQDVYVEKAKLAERCGFDGVDIKSCHGYLLSELLRANDRKGKYGGSFENRFRMLRETIKKVKQAVCKDFIVTTRLNVYDAFEYPYGFGVKENCGIKPDYTEAINLINELSGYGVNLVNITMGNPYVNPHVNRPFINGGYEPPEKPIEGVFRMLESAKEIKNRTNGNVKIISSGISYLGGVIPQVAAGYVNDGVEFIGLGRTTFAYPQAAIDIISGKFNNKKLCVCCSNCSKIMRAGGTPGCVIRDDLYTKIYQEMLKEGKIK